MDIVQLSNIFNVITQVHPTLKAYHFGWRSDILRNIDNNLDKEQSTGRLYPALHLVPFEETKLIDTENNKTKFDLVLYVDDLQHYKNDSTIEGRSLLEQWRDLHRIAQEVIYNFEKYSENFYDCQIVIDKKEGVKMYPDSNGHKDRVLTWRISFSITMFLDCLNDNNYFDPSTLDWSKDQRNDLENYKNLGLDIFVIENDPDSDQLPAEAQEAFNKKYKNGETVQLGRIPRGNYFNIRASVESLGAPSIKVTAANLTGAFTNSIPQSLPATPPALIIGWIGLADQPASNENETLYKIRLDINSSEGNSYCVFIEYTIY
jgi:hypothetical protein